MPNTKNAKPPPNVTNLDVSKAPSRKLLFLSGIREEQGSKRLTNSQTDPPCNCSSPDHCSGRTSRMARHRPTRDPPVIAPRRHRDRRDLASIAPLSEERHDECLHPCRAEQ